MSQSQGFGQRYWLQVVKLDGSEKWVPWKGDYQTAMDKAAKLVATGKNVDFVLVIDGKAPKQAVAMKRHILAEFNREQRPGTKLYKVKV